MTLFRPERRTQDLASAATLIALHSGRYNRSNSGVSVNDETALAHSAVWACVDLIGELVSTLPIGEYRKGSRGELIAQPPSAFIEDPAGDGYGFEVWCRDVMTSLLLRGNAYGWINAIGGDGWPSQIETLHPDSIQVKRYNTSGPAEWYRDGKQVEKWPAGPLWHMPAFTVPGSPVGMSPIRYAAETIGLGLATQEFGGQWFRDGAHPTSVLESDHEINQSQAQTLKERVLNATANNREPLVLGLGTKLTSIQVAPEESQFLETSRANIADVARYYRVPPEMIGSDSGSAMTYANVESRSLALLTYTLNGWMIRVERALSRLRPRPRFVKFNADALIRVDIKTRFEVHQIAIQNRIETPNEARIVEDMPPVPGGDEFITSAPAPAPPADTSGGGTGDGSTQPA